MRCHVQGFQCSKKTRINNSVHSKEASKDLPAKGCELGCLEDTERLGFVVIVGELGIVVHLIGNPAQYFVNVDGCRDGYSFTGAVGPSVFYSGGKTFTGTEGIQVRIGRHDGPDGAHVIVKVNGVHRDPCRTGLARW